MLKYGLKDVRNFIEGYAKFYSHLPQHEQDQVALRAFLCKPCTDNGACFKCGCKTPQMFYAPSKIDSDGKFAEFLNENQWRALVTNIEQYYEFITNLNKPDVVADDAIPGEANPQQEGTNS